MVNLTITQVSIQEDGTYKFTLQQSPGIEYTVKLTAAQCVDLATVQSTINSLAQPKKYIGQIVTVTLA